MATIKMFGLIPRKLGLTSQELHDHYRHPHGTIGRTIPSVRHYWQSHHKHTELLDKNQSRFEAVAELWLDSTDDVENFRKEPVVVKYILEDEFLFVDLDNLQILACHEEMIVSSPDANDPSRHPGDAMWSPDNRPNAIKILHFVESDGNTEWQSDDDKALGDSIGVFRHVRCTPLKSIHDAEAPFVGVRELWWPTVTAFERGVKCNPEAFATLIGQQKCSTTLLVTAERWK